MSLPSQESKVTRKLGPYVFKDFDVFQAKESLQWQSTGAIDTYRTYTIRTTEQKIMRAERTGEQSLPQSNAHV